jgi:hypothetical protein
LHNEEIDDCSSNQIKDYEIDREWAHMREKRNTYNVFVGKAEGKRLYGRPRHR